MVVWSCKGGVDRRSQNEGGEEWTNKMKDLGPAGQESIGGVRTKEGRNGRTK